jgi:PleD family two-component response regulator
MKTLLLVHDQQTSPAPRIQFLEMAGYRVIPLANSTEAMRAVTQNKPDLLLLDVLIAGQNGFELAAEVRKAFDAAALPIVMFSGIYRGRAYSEESLNVGVQEYLSSPVDLELLVRTVNQLVGGTKAEVRRAG